MNKHFINAIVSTLLEKYGLYVPDPTDVEVFDEKLLESMMNSKEFKKLMMGE